MGNAGSYHLFCDWVKCVKCVYRLLAATIGCAGLIVSASAQTPAPFSDVPHVRQSFVYYSGPGLRTDTTLYVPEGYRVVGLGPCDLGNCVNANFAFLLDDGGPAGRLAPGPNPPPTVRVALNGHAWSPMDVHIPWLAMLPFNGETLPLVETGEMLGGYALVRCAGRRSRPAWRFDEQWQLGLRRDAQGKLESALRCHREGAVRVPHCEIFWRLDAPGPIQVKLRFRRAALPRIARVRDLGVQFVAHIFEQDNLKWLGKPRSR